MKWKNLLGTLSCQTPYLDGETYQQLSGYEYLVNYPEKLYFEIRPGKLKDFFVSHPEWFKESLSALEWMEKNKVETVCYGDELYPVEFKQLNRPPLFLNFKGYPCWTKTEMLSVVGSRNPTFKSLEWMDQHLTPLVQGGTCLVSGAARGIDQKAHSISLRNKKPTIAFLPSGINNCYPKEFSQWVDRIIDAGGAVFSEYLPNQEMRRQHFLERNRMIAAMGKCLLVVEAKNKSGSSMTARLAIDNGQIVCVLPAFPTDSNFSGSVDLLFNGALPIRDQLDLKIVMDMGESRVPNSF